MESWLPHTLTWYWASSWPPGAPKSPFWRSWMDSEGPQGPDLVPAAGDWSAWVGIIVYHTLWPYIGPLLGPQGPQKGSFWTKRLLLGVLDGLEGPPEAKFGPNCHRLLCLSWTHVAGLFLAARGPKSARFSSKCPFFWSRSGPILGQKSELQSGKGSIPGESLW